MAASVMVLFMAIEKNKIVLPVKDWIEDLGDFVSDAYENRIESGLICISGRQGRPLYILSEIRDFYQLPGISFLNTECATLHNFELITAIQSLTITIDKLLSGDANAKNLVDKYIFGSQKIDYIPHMEKFFAQSTIPTTQNLDWEDGDTYVLFCLIKALIFILSDALANNKIFLYIEPVI